MAEDWLWHVVLPVTAYAVLTVAALLLRRRPAAGLYGVAVAALSLLYIGVHNAWDSVTFTALNQHQQEEKREEDC